MGTEVSQVSADGSLAQEQDEATRLRHRLGVELPKIAVVWK
jgi:hypothetical protein